MQSSPKDASDASNLPKLRKGLTYTFNDYDYDGKPQWLINDPARNKFFIVGWPEYEMLMRWDIDDPEDLIHAVNNETTLKIDMSDLDYLMKFLAYNYLLEQSSKTIYETAKSQNTTNDESALNWLIKHYLFFRVPIWHPDKFLSKTKSIGILLFNRYLFYAMMVLGVVALYQISMKWDLFVSTFPSIISWRGLFFYFIAFTVVKLLHESGHAYKCKEYGIPVPTFGIAFLVFWPVLYTDTTLSWTLNSKKRLRIAIAGIQVETYVTIIAALIWCNTNNLTLQTICYISITVNWISSLLINVSPFMRFDGYYILSDLLKMPNLQYRSFTLTRWQIRSWLFDWQEPPPEQFSRKMHNGLVLYAIVTWLYRLLLYLGIAILVYHLLFKAIGIILFVIEIYYFILEPIIKELKLWMSSREKFRINVHTIVTATVILMLFGIFFIPFRSSITLPATMSYAHQFLYAAEEGIVIKALPAVGTKIKANATIAEIGSPMLFYALKRTRLEYDKLLSEKRRASTDSYYAKDKNSILSALNKKRSEYQKLIDLRKKLILDVPFDGILIDSAVELTQGSYVTKNEWLGDVINPKEIEVEGYVDQVDLDLLKPGQSGYFYPDDFSENKVPIVLTLIEPLNPSSLACQYSQNIAAQSLGRAIVETPCYNASEFGGEIPTYVIDTGELVPVKSVYRVLFTIKDDVRTEGIHLQRIQRGSVAVKSTARSYAYRFFYNVKNILVKESGF